MKSVIGAASTLAMLWLGLGGSAYAQESETSPPPPPPPVQVRERAVPRVERAPDLPEQPGARAPESKRPAPQPVREAPPVREAAPARDPSREAGTGNDGSRRRPPVATSVAPVPAPAAANATPAAEQTERPGAVRRPPSTGTGSSSPRDRAVARVGPPPDPDRDHHPVYVYPDYWSYGHYYYDPYYPSFYLGYLAYSPWGWMPAFYGYPYGGGYAPYYQAQGWDLGRVRLKVKPRDAEVFVDGYFAGQVDDFDGTFQSLRLDSGPHRIEVRKPGFDTIVFDVHVQPDRTITYRGDMRAIP